MALRRWWLYYAFERASARLLVMGVCLSLGCDRSPPEPFRPYDSVLWCPGAYVEVLDADDIVSRLDVNGDGSLESEDLSPGEAVFLLRTSGMHVDGHESHPGVSAHADFNAYIERHGTDWVLRGTVDCRPTARISVSFQAGEHAPGELYESALTRLDFRVVDYELATLGETEVEGDMVGVMGEGTVSGRMNGAASGALHSEVAEVAGHPEITGQTIHVDAVVFRDIEVRR